MGVPFDQSSRQTHRDMRFKTDFNGYAVKFSPFEDGRIAVATSQNFGIIGNGRQYVLQVQYGHLL